MITGTATEVPRNSGQPPGYRKKHHDGTSSVKHHENLPCHVLIRKPGRLSLAQSHGDYTTFASDPGSSHWHGLRSPAKSAASRPADIQHPRPAKTTRRGSRTVTVGGEPVGEERGSSTAALSAPLSARLERFEVTAPIVSVAAGLVLTRRPGRRAAGA